MIWPDGFMRKVTDTLYESLSAHKSKECHEYFEDTLTITPY